MRPTAQSLLAALALVAGASSALAQFTAGNLVVMTVGGENAGGGNSVSFREYTTGGTFVPGSLVNLPTSGNDAFSMSDVYNHGRHLHRSADGRYLVFAGYGVAPGAADPGTSTGVARVVGLLGQNGSVDLSTRLSDAYLGTTVRGAYSTDGTQIWVAGDNEGTTSTSGGIRYTTRGSSTSSNLSRTQVGGGSPTPDNIRDLNVFGGQLYDSSGSGSSVGRGVLAVGSGLPTSGSQTITNLTTAASADSASSFYMLDLDGTVGMDTLYFVGDSAVRRYNLVGGSWVFRGTLTTGFTAAGVLDQIIAAPNGTGGVTLYVAGPSAVLSLTDSSPLGAAVGFSVPSTLITAPAGTTLGGIEFAPVPTPAAAALLLGAAPAAFRRRRR
ncbi:MAG: hypothetical protein QM783_02555 [Phycisphaerales bacterium]